MKNIDEITIFLPLSILTDEEQISLIAVYVCKKETNDGVLPTSLTTDEEKINFTFSVEEAAQLQSNSPMQLLCCVKKRNGPLRIKNITRPTPHRP